MVLKKTAALVAAGRFDDAYDYCLFMKRNWPNWPGVSDAIENCLLQEAEQSRGRGQYDGALALLRKLREPQSPAGPRRADRAIHRKPDPALRSKGNYAAARALVQGLAADYPEHPVAVRWRERLTRQAAPLLAEARKAADAGQWDKASERMREWPRSGRICPRGELAKTVYQNYSRVVVGVGAISGNPLPDRPDDWTARRDSRLLYRTLTEFIGASSEGGKYDCPPGMISSGNLGRRLTFQLKPGVGWAEGTPCSAASTCRGSCWP